MSKTSKQRSDQKRRKARKAEVAKQNAQRMGARSGVKRAYDKSFSPKAVAKQLIALANVKGHDLMVCGAITREPGRIDAIPVQCRICAQVGIVRVDQNRQKIVCTDFSPLDDRCFTEAEFERVLELGHEWDESDGVPKCKHCGTERRLDGKQEPCETLEGLYDHVKATRDEEGTSVPGTMRRLRMLKASGVQVTDETVKTVMEHAGGTIVDDNDEEIYDPDEEESDDSEGVSEQAGTGTVQQQDPVADGEGEGPHTEE